ncbi:hypothetical protein Hanom_Chr14g01251951 [Helianthus anomalus]
MSNRFSRLSVDDGLRRVCGRTKRTVVNGERNGEFPLWIGANTFSLTFTPLLRFLFVGETDFVGAEELAGDPRIDLSSTRFSWV